MTQIYLVGDSDVKIYAENRWEAYLQCKKMGFHNIRLKRT